MKKVISVALLLAVILALSACGQKKAEPETVGGWTVGDGVLTEEAQAAFDKAMDSLVGVSYSPLVLLGTQGVSGTNYCVLCEASVVYPDAKPYYALVYVYENLQGETEILNIAALNLGDIAESGEIRNADAEAGQTLGGWTVDRDSKVEVDNAVMHLASQLVSGTNHCVLCKGWTLSFVYENLEGKTEVTKTVDLDIAALSQPSEAE